jgi:selenocysteine lyase/cysteine desulfurase
MCFYNTNEEIDALAKGIEKSNMHVLIDQL